MDSETLNPKFEFGSFFEIIFNRPSYQELKEKLSGTTTQKSPGKVPESYQIDIRDVE